MLTQIAMWFRGILESLNGGKARRAAEWKQIKNPNRVEGGKKAAATRRKNKADARIRELYGTAELYRDDESDAAPTA